MHDFHIQKEAQMLPIALKAVQLQLQAMGADRYELGVRVPPEKSDDGKSHMKLRNGRGECQRPPRLHPPLRAEPAHPDRRSDP
jgi:hypothetical protein